MIAYNVPKIYNGMRTNGPIFPRYLKKIGRKVTVASVRSGIGESTPSIRRACRLFLLTIRPSYSNAITSLFQTFFRLDSYTAHSKLQVPFP